MKEVCISDPYFTKAKREKVRLRISFLVKDKARSQDVVAARELLHHRASVFLQSGETVIEPFHVIFIRME